MTLVVADVAQKRLAVDELARQNPRRQIRSSHLRRVAHAGSPLPLLMLRFARTLLRQLVEAFGKYQLVRRLGAGGMAEVFLAREPLAQGLAKILVIKKIHPSLAETPQFRQHVRGRGQGRRQPEPPEHRADVRLRPDRRPPTSSPWSTSRASISCACSTPPSRPTCASRSACAPTSGSRWPRRSTTPTARPTSTAKPLGIVHRDVSPQNILVSWDGMVKLVDFGIARARHVHEDEGVVKGKFAYMSPEQAAGTPVDPRCDIFSTGIVLWELMLRALAVRQLEGQAGAQRHQERAGAAAARARRVDPRGARGDHPQVPVEAARGSLPDRARSAPRARAVLLRALVEGGQDLRVGLDGGADRAGHPGSRAARRSAGAAGGRAARRCRARRDAAAAVEVARPRARQAMPISCCSRPSARASSSSRASCRRCASCAATWARRARARRCSTFCASPSTSPTSIAAHPDRLDDRGFTYVIGLPVGTEDDATRAVRAGARAHRRARRHLARAVAAAEASRSACRAARRWCRARRRPAARRPSSSTSSSATRRRSRAAWRREAMPGEILVGGGIFRGARADWSFEELDSIELPPDSDTSPGSRRQRRRARGHRRARQASIASSGRGRAPIASPITPGLRRLVGRDLELSMLLRRAPRRRRAEPRALRARARRGRRRQGEHRRRLPPQARSVRRTWCCAASARPTLRDNPYAMVADLDARSLRPERRRRAARGQAAHRGGGAAAASSRRRSARRAQVADALGVAARRQGAGRRRARRRRAAPSALRGACASCRRASPKDARSSSSSRTCTGPTRSRSRS